MKKQSGFSLVHFIPLVIALLGFIGWVWNIVKVAQSDFAVLTGLLVLRIVGIFVAPLGAILGYF
jgi:hypothetical protein